MVDPNFVWIGVGIIVIGGLIFWVFSERKWSKEIDSPE